MNSKCVAPFFVLIFVVVLCPACRHSEPTSTIVVPSGGVTVEGTSIDADGRLMVTAEPMPWGHVMISVTNGTEDIVMLRRGLKVEQLTVDEWEELEAVGDVWIRTECSLVDGAVFPEGLGEHCFGLSPRTSVKVVPWLGTFGHAQCSCENCTPVPEGTYRIVAQGCDGERYESTPAVLVVRGGKARAKVSPQSPTR